LYFPIFEFTGSSYVTYIASQSENIFPFCDLSKCGLTGVFLYPGIASVSENSSKRKSFQNILSRKQKDTPAEHTLSHRYV
jgi:hypothetical protein